MSDLFNPKVSIIIPVYNGSNYLREAIDSALKQTYKNLEIIVVNDGSCDEGKTEAIALSYGDKIRYFSKPNGGTSTALNLGIRNMKGEYFSWLSHDDMYYENKISRQIEELAKLDNKETIMMSDLDGIDENYNNIYITNYINHIRAYPPRESSMLHPIVYNQTHGCTLLIPKSCFDTVGMFDEEQLVAQDFEFFYRAFSVFPHKLIPEILVTARDSSNRQGRRCKSGANAEYSALYIKILENLSDEEVCELAPTRLQLYEDMEQFFLFAGYTIALDYLHNLCFSNLQLSSYDIIGRRFNGFDLHLDFREKDISSKVLVLNKQSTDKSTYIYDFFAPGASKALLEQSLFLNASVVHLHLVHNIFNLSYLPAMSALRPTVISLHDPFFLGGHCVHHGTCEKWKSHCHDCEYLDEPFALDRDISSLNFRLKKDAIQNSQISAIVASDWMRKKVEQSPIWAGKKIYTLPFGVDHSVFCPGEKQKAREKLGINNDALVLFFRAESWQGKGTSIIAKALEQIYPKVDTVIFTVGEKNLLHHLSEKYNIIDLGWINDDENMVNLYRACDLFIMPSVQEAFGMMSIEAMSCGAPVLVLDSPGSALVDVTAAPEFGFSATKEDFTETLESLMGNRDFLSARGKKCSEFAKIKYSKEAYIEGMLEIYHDVIASHKMDANTELLFSQLRKNAQNHFYLEPPDPNVVFNNSLSFPKKIIKQSFRSIWKIVKLCKLDKHLESTQLYSLLKERGIVKKFR